jgi:hypothetical protein
MDSGTLRLSAVPSTSGGSFPTAHGTLYTGHGTFNQVTVPSTEVTAPSTEVTAPSISTRSRHGTLGISRTAAREPSPTGLQQEGSTQKQDCTKCWTEAASLRGSTLRLEAQ